MPKMGESVMEGTVITWHKKPGETVEQDEALLEIGTDKVDSEIPSPASGMLTEILIAEGATVDVGTVLAHIETDVEAISAEPPGSSVPRTEPPSGPPGGPVSATPPPGPSPKEGTPAAVPAVVTSVVGGKVTDVVMPKMGESVMEGTVISWSKQVGEAVDLDETLLEIGTDKVDSEIPSPASGVLVEILVAEGMTVEVGTVLCRIAAERTVPSMTSTPVSERPVAAGGSGTTAPETPSAPAVSAPAPEVVEAVGRRGSDGRFYSPLVRAIAQEEKVSAAELAALPGSGKEGRVTKRDLLSYLEKRQATSPAEAPVAARAFPESEVRPAAPTAPASRPSPAGGARVEIVEMDRMRQIIAEHMVRSKTTSAHVTSFAEADVTGLVTLRESAKDGFLRREGVKLTYTPFFVRAAVDALRTHPYLNASIEGTRILLKKDFHVGIAVAVGDRGLVVPVIRDAGGKNLVGMARAAADLAERARNKQLQPDDLQGGTFTVTNVGSLGTIIGTPIINQPQVAILAVGTIKKRPVVLEDPRLGDVIAIRHMMYLSLTYDHRLIDGAMASSFIQNVVHSLETIGPNDEI